MAEINKDKEPVSKIIAFPRSLRSKADDKMPHVCFSLTGKASEDITAELERIHLYIPAGFQVQDGANFNTLELGALMAARKVADRGEGGKASEVFSGTANTVMGLKAIEGITGDGGTAALGAMEQGVAFNPQTALAFESVNLRTFGFAFTLVPESADEAEDARRIDNFFRKYMYPTTETGFSLKYPPKFKIQFFIGEKENPFMPMIHDCYLAGVDSTYNPDSNAFFIDGQPTAINLSLSFSETKQLTRTDIFKEGSGPEDPSFDYSRPGSYPTS